MKKVVTIILSIVTIIATLGVVAFVLVKTDIIHLHDIDKVTVYTHQDENGLIYTEREWEWKPIESRDIISYVDTTGVEKQTISLHIEDIEFYNIQVPAGNYIYDYGKTIWAEDGSYLIRVIGDVTLDTLTKTAGIDNGENLDQYTITTPEGQKGKRTICTLLNGNIAIVADVYNGSETYSIIRDSLMNNKETIYMDNIDYADNYKELTSVSYTGKYVPQVHYSQFDLTWKRYLFADGELSVYAKYERIFDVEEVMLAQLCVFAQTPIEELYKDESIIYASAGDWHVGMLRYNTNTTVVLFGSGEEAKCNIVALLDSIK